LIIKIKDQIPFRPGIIVPVSERLLPYSCLIDDVSQRSVTPIGLPSSQPQSGGGDTESCIRSAADESARLRIFDIELREVMQYCVECDFKGVMD
jgi:hypothetical protein